MVNIIYSKPVNVAHRCGDGTKPTINQLFYLGCQGFGFPGNMIYNGVFLFLHIYVCFLGLKHQVMGIENCIKFILEQSNIWAFKKGWMDSMGDLQDPKMEVLYQRAYFVGIFPYIGLI